VVTAYGESPTAEVADPLDIGDSTTELGRILKKGRLRNVFQPIVELDTGLTVAYEALARGPESSPLKWPDQLFAAARHCGRLTELDLACQNTAMKAALRAGLTGSWSVFINVEPEAARDAMRTPDDFLPARGGVPAQGARLRVIAELTERSLTADPPELLDLVARVRSRGWGIAVDDVGADRSSLALLPFVRPDVIKLDLRLIQQRPSAEIAEIFSAVNAEAERSGTAVLAEGIENRAHLNTARSLGATLGQGWLFGRPGPPPKSAAPPAASTIRTIERDLAATAEAPFALAAAAVPPRMARKDLLIEISKHIERQAMHSGETTAVLASFQNAAFFTPATRHRYSQLAQCAAFVGILGRGMPLSPMPGIRGGPLSPADPLLSEWNIAVIGPHFASCLTARDLGDSGPDQQRRFEFVLSHKRELAIKVATALLSRVSPKA
jgi:EAL domain-containing protein (putative c-di-GMP-specific phosphodiesterase class I)/DICT domain-containing protein